MCKAVNRGGTPLPVRPPRHVTCRHVNACEDPMTHVRRGGPHVGHRAMYLGLLSASFPGFVQGHCYDVPFSLSLSARGRLLGEALHRGWCGTAPEPARFVWYAGADVHVCSRLRVYGWNIASGFLVVFRLELLVVLDRRLFRFLWWWSYSQFLLFGEESVAILPSSRSKVFF